MTTTMYAPTAGAARAVAASATAIQTQSGPSGTVRPASASIEDPVQGASETGLAVPSIRGSRWL